MFVPGSGAAGAGDGSAGAGVGDAPPDDWSDAGAEDDGPGAGSEEGVDAGASCASAFPPGRSDAENAKSTTKQVNRTSPRRDALPLFKCGLTLPNCPRQRRPEGAPEQHLL